MISLCNISVDSPKNIVFDELALSENEELSARVTRVKTLDGGCEIIHSGVSDADRTLRYTAFLNAEKAGIISWLFKNETLITVANNDGVFLAVIEKFYNDNGKVKITLLVKEIL